ncbi:MAG: hypothetical protein ABWY53_04275, partial [Leifsonia flava]
STLAAHGIRRADIATALNTGELRRLRRGWFATPIADVDQLRAVALGGRLGCVSALRRWGVWSGAGDDLHVTVPRSASHLSLDSDTERYSTRPALWHPSIDRRLTQGQSIRLASRTRPIVHWAEHPNPERRLDWIVSAHQALSQAVLCQDEENAIACLDSAIRHGVIRAKEARSILDALPARLHPLGRELTPTADSGWDSIAITRIRRGGFAVRSQAEIAGVGRLDGLIEDCVGLEVNGLGFHAGATAVQRDVNRVLVAQRLGIPTITVTPRHVSDDWPATWETIVRVVTDEMLRHGR